MSNYETLGEWDLVDFANTRSAALKGLLFTIFLGCLGLAVWAHLKWQHGIITADQQWRAIGFCMLGVVACIAGVGVIDFLRGEQVSPIAEKIIGKFRRKPRGFDVITKDDE